MNGRDILECMSNDVYISKTFFNVYPADVRLNCSKPGLYVLNTDVSGLPGTHWLLVLITNNCDGYIFDSLGFNLPYTRRITDSINGNAYSVINRCLQSDESQLCGAYALYFARNLAKGVSIRTIVKPFEFDPTANDCFIQKYVWDVFGKYMTIRAQ